MKLLTLVFAIATTTAVFASNDCRTLEGRFKTIYCIDEGESSDLVYYLHGSGGDEQTWFDPFFYTSQIREEWKWMKVKKPTVVSITFDLSIYSPNLGKRWLMVEKNNLSQVSGILSEFTDFVLPEIEKSLPKRFEHRSVFGDSMGGINSILLGLKTDLFEKVGVICAPMAESVDPFSSPEEIEVYAKSTLAWDYFSYVEGGHEIIKETLEGAFKLVKSFAPSRELIKEVNPIDIIKNYSPKRANHFYITAGAYDPYLVYEGSLRLVQLMMDRNVDVQWRPQWGGHCAIDIKSLAEFLVR